MTALECVGQTVFHRSIKLLKLSQLQDSVHHFALAFACRGSSGAAIVLKSATQIEGRSTKLRAAVTNRPLRLRGLDSRSRAGRRRADLITLYMVGLGGRHRITEKQLADVVRAAELVAVAEEARFAALTRGVAAIDLAALVKIEGTADRAVRRLNLQPSVVEAAPPPRPAKSLSHTLRVAGVVP